MTSDQQKLSLKGKKAHDVAEEAVGEARNVTEKATRSALQASSEGVENINKWTQASAEDLRQLTELHERAAYMFVAMNREILDFVQRRLRVDAETCSEFLNCRDPQSLVDLQTAWTNRAVQDFLTETKSICELGTNIWNGQMKEGRDSSRSAPHKQTNTRKQAA